MIRLLSSKNTNVSKIWFVVLAFFLAVVLIAWDTIRTVKELEENVLASSAEFL